MAGLDDYKFYMAARGEDSPFWERRAPAAGAARPTSLPLPDPPAAAAAAASASAAEETTSQYLVVGANVAGLLADHVLTHPFVVLRRQCQVNAAARRYHLTPVTLPAVLYNLHRHQGLAVLWKGLGSAVIVKGLGLAAEDLVSKVTGWPREVARGSSARQAGRHLLLRAAALALTAPFSAASVAESVQSEVASERPGVLDVLTEGACRAAAGLAPHSAGRLLPVWTVSVPAALFGLLHYLLSAAGAELALLALRLRAERAERRRGAVSRAGRPLDACHRRLAAAAVGRYVAELALYPLETVLRRLQLQGTRSIIDNLDTGSSVLPVTTRYEGALDCLRTVLREEGWPGLYRGVGALAAQAAAHAALLYAARCLTEQAAALCAGAPPPAAAGQPSPLPADETDAGDWREVPTPGAGDWREVLTPGGRDAADWREVHARGTAGRDVYSEYSPAGDGDRFDRYREFDAYRQRF